VDESDEVVVALGVGLADKINSLYNANFLVTKLVGNEVFAGLLIVSIRGAVVIAGQ